MLPSANSVVHRPRHWGRLMVSNNARSRSLLSPSPFDSEGNQLADRVIVLHDGHTKTLNPERCTAKAESFRERQALFQLFEPVEDNLNPWADAGRAFA